jgi:type I restriction enzyme S subunit
MSLPGYERYKDSGVQWSGDVPAHWILTRLIRIAVSRCDGPFGSGLKSEHYTDDGARVVRLQNIRAGVFDGTDEAFVDLVYFESELAGHAVVEGDILIAGLGDERNTVGRACVAPAGIAPALVKADCFRFRLDREVAHPGFVSAALNAGSVSDAGIMATGSTRSRISLSVMGSRRLALPPLTEQSAIAAFLDRETAKIDALVEEQKRLIELLKEKRQAVISHAVTKGLDPNAPMKDSGVEWLGEVPAHWDVLSIRRVSRSVQTGGTPKSIAPENDMDGGINWFTPGDFDNSILLRTAQKQVHPDTVQAGDAKVFNRGSVLIVSIGATLGKVGLLQSDASANQQINAIAPDQTIDAYFLSYMLSSKTNEMRFLSNASTIGIMNQEKTKEISVARPPVSEQLSIVNHLDAKLAEIDALTAESEVGVSLLQERRSALISAAVTGKIDVRAAASVEAEAA